MWQRAAFPVLVVFASFATSMSVEHDVRASEGSGVTAATPSGFFSNSAVLIDHDARDVLGRVENLLATQDEAAGTGNAVGDMATATGTDSERVEDGQQILHQSLIHAVKAAISLPHPSQNVHHSHPHPHPHPRPSTEQKADHINSTIALQSANSTLGGHNATSEAPAHSGHTHPHPHPALPAVEVLTDPQGASEAHEASLAANVSSALAPPPPPADAPKSVVLVANGRSVLSRKMGKVIDSFDIVGRYNYFELGDFKRFVGTRTDLWFLGEMKVPGPTRVRGKHTGFTSKRQMNLKIRPTMKYLVPVVYKYQQGNCNPKNAKSCLCGKTELQRVKKLQKQIVLDYAKFGLADKLEIVDVTNQFTLATKYGYSEAWPSSGVMSIIYCLEHFGAPVTIHGFDFMGHSLGHYFEKVKKTWTSHSMGGEGKFIKKLINRGLVKVL